MLLILEGMDTSSRKKGAEGEVIKAWDIGIVNIKVEYAILLVKQSMLMVGT